MSDIRNFKSSMSYRTFGKTAKKLSVITLGGMRYKHGWNEPREEVPAEMLTQCMDCVQRALACGINHIETAYGYGKSEHCYGKVLKEELTIPRDLYWFMTKGAPETGDATRDYVEQQLTALKMDAVDFYGWHGINNREKFKMACATGGPVEKLLRLKEERMISHVGFSTHGPLDVILDSINTGMFDFVNLHYYYFFQRNFAAVKAAAERNMGVFIISPNDKGGQLFFAPQELRELTDPLTPIQWNARFCLKTPMVHTLSFGMTDPSHFDEMIPIATTGVDWNDQDQRVLEALDNQKSVDPWSAESGYTIDPGDSGLNIPEILRFRQMWKCYNMETWCSYRYNMFQEKGDWFPGGYATNENVAKIPDSSIPKGMPLREMLKEFHERFYVEKE